MDWFAKWYNTLFLYKNRNYKEIQTLISYFIGNLYLSRNPNVRDLACGKITFSVKGKKSHYQERSGIGKKEYFKTLTKQIVLNSQTYFGDYKLNSFNEEPSPRLILILNK